MQVVDEAEVSPICEQRGDSVTLAVADLERKEAVGRERGAGLRDEAAIDVQAIGACEESG